MSYDIDPNALASALPARITYILGSDRDDWTALDVARFQAERLAESGYRLVYVGDDPGSRLLAALAAVGPSDTDLLAEPVWTDDEEDDE